MNYLIIIASILFSISTFADTVFVSDTNGIGISKDEANAVEEIIKSSVTESGHQVTTDSKQAKYVLRSKVMKLGTAVVVTMEKVEGSKTVFSQQLKAEKIEDLDNITSRLTKSVLEEKNVKTAAEVTDLNETDKTDGGKRRQSIGRWQLGLGGAFQANTDRTETLFNFILGYEWELPLSNSSIRLNWEGAEGFGLFSLGGNYFFSSKDYSPVVQASLGYGSATHKDNSWFNGVDDDDISGFGYTVGIGLRMFRLSSTNLEPMIQYSQIMKKLKGEIPSQFVVKVSVYY